MKKIIAMLAILLAATAAKADTYTIKVGEFSELEVNGQINVVYSSNPDSVGLVAFDTKPEYARLILTSVNKGKLKLELSQEADGITKLPTGRAYSSYLSRAENTKDSTLFIHNVKPAAKINFVLQGNGRLIASGIEATNLNLQLQTGKGTLTASGKCGTLSANLIGTGNIQADEVQADEAKCKIVGTGTIGVNASKKLSVSGMGSGRVYSKGQPPLSTSQIGKIKAIPLDAQTGNPENLEVKPLQSK